MMKRTVISAAMMPRILLILMAISVQNRCCSYCCAACRLMVLPAVSKMVMLPAARPSIPVATNSVIAASWAAERESLVVATITETYQQPAREIQNEGIFIESVCRVHEMSPICYLHGR
ncbi:MAG: hypothetical protein ACI8P2_002393 [Candidatus Latescibacterota bacterium]|jgi:hypothetical protein